MGIDPADDQRQRKAKSMPSSHTYVRRRYAHVMTSRGRFWRALLFKIVNISKMRIFYASTGTFSSNEALRPCLIHAQLRARICATFGLLDLLTTCSLHSRL
jgi:hypothetical protein